MGKVTAIKTDALGRLTWTEFNRLVKAANGNQAQAARNVTEATGKAVPAGTFRKWGERLRAARTSA